jgi:hypothetical protein
MQGDDRFAGSGSPGQPERPVVGLAVGDGPLRGVQVGPPGGEVALHHPAQLVVGVEVNELHAARRPRRRGDRVVVRGRLARLVGRADLVQRRAGHEVEQRPLLPFR